MHYEVRDSILGDPVLGSLGIFDKNPTTTPPHQPNKQTQMALRAGLNDHPISRARIATSPLFVIGARKQKQVLIWASDSPSFLLPSSTCSAQRASPQQHDDRRL